MLLRSETVGLSYGVIHKGVLVHLDSFGFRDFEKRAPMDEETMMPICSMTKSLVIAALGLLVEDGKLNWDSLVHQLLPDFAPRSSQLKESATLLDFLSMRSGIEGYNIWSQSDNRINFSKADSMKIINSLQSVSEIRYQFAYNNWGYEIAGHICDKVGGKSWDNMLHSNFFEPLGMDRTDARGRREKFDNVARAYMVLDDGSPVQIPATSLSGETLMGPAGGVQSCIKDLVRLYQAILKACIHQFESGETSTPGSPFKQVAIPMSTHMPLPGSSLRESSYGMGWIRTQLPNQMCKISPNYGLLGTAPVVGEGAPSKIVLAHYGSMPGAFAGVNLFPETESAIFALTNTTPMCDIADWMTQLLTQTLFDFPKKNNYVEWVDQTVQAECYWYENVVKDMNCNQSNESPPKDLEQYVEKYYNSASTFLIEIRLGQDKLALSFEGRDDELFSLKYCQGESFTWIQPRNELVRRGRVVLQSASYYMIRFESSDQGSADGLFWTHDSRMPKGERYLKLKEL